MRIIIEIEDRADSGVSVVAPLSATATHGATTAAASTATDAGPAPSFGATSPGASSGASGTASDSSGGISAGAAPQQA